MFHTEIAKGAQGTVWTGYKTDRYNHLMFAGDLDDMEEIKMRFGGDLEDVTERLEVRSSSRLFAAHMPSLLCSFRLSCYTMQVRDMSA